MLQARRYSTPATKSPATVLIDSSGRRYTTIPVSSEMAEVLSPKKFYIGSPPDSPFHVQSASSSSDSTSGPKRSLGGGDSSSGGSKRDLGQDSTRDKASKMLKLSVQTQMKENVDPRGADEPVKTFNLTRRGSQASVSRRAHKVRWLAFVEKFKFSSIGNFHHSSSAHSLTLCSLWEFKRVNVVLLSLVN